MSVSTISPGVLAQRHKDRSQLDLIDVRTPVEFREVHVQFARNVPLDQLDPQRIMQSRQGALDEPLYVICRSGGRGQQACQKFLDAGYANVLNVEGGTQACDAAGLPLVHGPKAMSLERQAAHCRRLACAVGSGARLLGASGLDRPSGIRRRGVGVCRHYRHLRNGFAARPHALEPLRGRIRSLRLEITPTSRAACRRAAQNAQKLEPGRAIC